MKFLLTLTFVLLISKLTEETQFRVGFYSRELYGTRAPTSGVHGITMDQQLSGQQGDVQVAVDPNIIPIFSDLIITLWNGTIVKTYFVFIKY